MLNFIVGSALLLAGAFFAAWLISPGLRKRIEQPKYTFLEQAQRFDADRGATGKLTDTQVEP